MPDPVQALITPHLLLPTQLPRAWPSMHGSHRLMVAVFEGAVHDILRLPSYNGGRRTARTDAIAWILSDDTSWPFSFQNICAQLNLNVEAVRRALRTTTAAPPANLRQRLRGREPSKPRDRLRRFVFRRA